jgi:SAM-dependent methyltransferase
MHAQLPDSRTDGLGDALAGWPAAGREIERWYAHNVRQFGYGVRALGFGRRGSQERRFEALLALGELDGARLLDVGCGFADLLGWLHARGIRPRYFGLDICAPMIEHCRSRYDARDAQFAHGDVLSWEPDRGANCAFDYVCASGIFGYAASGMAQRVEPTLARMYGWAQKGLAANFLSRRAPRHARERLYLDPAEILGIGLQLSPAVRIDHSYMPNDFTLHVYRTPVWTKEEAA